MADPTPDRRLPPLELERYLLGELPAERMAALQQREADDADFAALVRELRADDDAIAVQYPAGRMASEIEERAGMGPTARLKGSWVSWALPILATAVVMFVALPPDRPTDPSADPALTAPAGDEVRPKSGDLGDPEVRVYRQQAGEAEALDDGATVAAGDVIQVAYAAGAQPYGVIVSIDGAGSVTLHWPPDAAGTTALDGGLERKLDRAFALDDAPGFERFYFVSAQLPLDPAVVVAAAKELAANGLARTALALPLQQKVQQDTLILQKPESP